MGDRGGGEKGRKLGEKSADLLGHPRPVPGSSGHLELGTGTLGQTSPALQPSAAPARGMEAQSRCCPWGAGQLEPRLESSGREAGAAPSAVPGH